MTRNTRTPESTLLLILKPQLFTRRGTLSRAAPSEITVSEYFRRNLKHSSLGVKENGLPNKRAAKDFSIPYHLGRGLPRETRKYDLSATKHVESSPTLQELRSFKGRIGCAICNLYRFFSGPLTPLHKNSPHSTSPESTISETYAAREDRFYKVFTLITFPSRVSHIMELSASSTLNFEEKSLLPTLIANPSLLLSGLKRIHPELSETGRTKDQPGLARICSWKGEMGRWALHACAPPPTPVALNVRGCSEPQPFW